MPITWPYRGFSQWPEGYRAAACFTWDVDDEAPFYSRPRTKRFEVSEIEQRQYGVRRALPMIVEMLESMKIPGAFYVPAFIARRWSTLFYELSAAGYEIGGHGDLHEPVGGMMREEEARIIAQSKHVLQEVCGHEIIGYRTPAWQCTPATMDLLTQAGFLYDSSLMGDIAPYRVRSGGQTDLIEVPIHWYWDDVEYWGHTQATRDHAIAPLSHVLEIWKAELDGVVRSGGSFVLTLHPHVSGRPGLLEVVREFIAYAQSVSGLWLTTPSAVAQYVRTCDGMPVVEMAPAEPDSRYSRVQI